MKLFWLMLALSLAGSLSGGACASDLPTAPGVSTTPPGGDPYLWLEEVHGERALDWVRAQNKVTRQAFMGSSTFARTRREILEVLNSGGRIPYAQRMGSYLYNFWQDKAHPRGIWRRTTRAEYRKPNPRWETVLDIDALNKVEGKKWVFKGAQCMKPMYKLCLVSLSPNGGDAVEVREFDSVSRSFVEDGFILPVAKTRTAWIDANHLYVATDFGRGSMTKSSFPRIVKEWTRGTPLSTATVVYKGKLDDMSVVAYRDRTDGFERDFVSVADDFFHRKTYLRRGDQLVRMEVPSDSRMTVHRQWLLIQTKSPWKVAGQTWPAGALLAIKFDDFIAGGRNFVLLFAPDRHTALRSYSWTRHHLLVNILEDVKGRIMVLSPRADGNWSRSPLPGVPDNSTVSASAVDPDDGDAYWLRVTGYLTPSTLALGTIGEGDPTVVKQEPAFFDVSGFAVSQHFAISKDGTQVPYFEVSPKGLALNHENRVLQTGYGGFGVSLLPQYGGEYQGVVGRAWLERGGVFVVANIRGGGEYGPRWHKAAMKADRIKAYEDFAAVAQDLIARGVTSPPYLAAEGASNGGLLVGNMLTEYPQLFGAIACEAPLLDMKRYTHLAAGTSWIAEYGDPDDPAQWRFIKTFSPYQNVEPNEDYPPVLFYTSTTDDRVGPQQARKMAAKMDAMGYEDVWFYEGAGGGHSPGADNAEAATMRALVYEFLWDRLQ